MRIDRKFFIGYDSTQPTAYKVCRQSLIDTGVRADRICPLDLAALEEVGLYWRDDADRRSTEFTNSRFLVPYLSGFYGQAIFCDTDFLWRHNPEVLFDLAEAAPHHPVFVVKHDIKEEQLATNKMNGQKQVWYPKKNWSSLMVFNNAHEECKMLMPEMVNEAEASWLHRFEWASINNVPSLPKTFNCLVGYGYDVKDPYAVHFTDGGPWLTEYESVEYAEEWRSVQQRIE